MHNSSWNPARVVAFSLNKPSRKASPGNRGWSTASTARNSLKVNGIRHSATEADEYRPSWRVSIAHNTADSIEVGFAKEARCSYRKAEKGYELVARKIPQVQRNMMSGGSLPPELQQHNQPLKEGYRNDARQFH